MNLCDHPVKDVLDIGTGSGILALMLAQRFPTAQVHAVELEPDAAKQAHENAEGSPFRDRITVHQRAFQGWEEASIWPFAIPVLQGSPQKSKPQAQLGAAR